MTRLMLLLLLLVMWLLLLLLLLLLLILLPLLLLLMLLPQLTRERLFLLHLCSPLHEIAAPLGSKKTTARTRRATLKLLLLSLLQSRRLRLLLLLLRLQPQSKALKELWIRRPEILEGPLGPIHGSNGRDGGDDVRGSVRRGAKDADNGIGAGSVISIGAILRNDAVVKMGQRRLEANQLNGAALPPKTPPAMAS